MNHKKHIKLATGIGMAAGGLLVGVAALYTEVITSVVARRRNAFTDGIVAATQGGGGGIDPTIRDKARALREIPMEQVSIRSHDGYVLRARWYPAENAERTVILAHGWHGAWNTDFSLSAPLLHNRGCNLLLIDQRCHGDSGGDLISYGIRERYDILSWLDYLTEQGIGLPVYLCGISMGASTVLMTAELPVADRVSGIIADCGYSTPDEIVSLALRNAVGCMTAPTLAAVNLNCKRRGGFTLRDASPIEAMAKNKEIPCLFIHGDEDHFVPLRMSIENFYACQAPKELWIVHGADHGLSFVVDPEGYERKITAFFAAWDTRLPSAPSPAEKKGIFKKRT